MGLSLPKCKNWCRNRMLFYFKSAVFAPLRLERRKCIYCSDVRHDDKKWIMFVHAMRVLQGIYLRNMYITQVISYRKHKPCSALESRTLDFRI